MTCKLVAEIGTCFGPYSRESFWDACEAALDCGADLVKVQIFDPKDLARRRGIGPEKLEPWDIRNFSSQCSGVSQGEEQSRLTEKCYRLVIGASVFGMYHLRTCIAPDMGHWGGLAFIKTASSEWQHARLAEAASLQSCWDSIPLFVSVPPDATLAIGNYFSSQPITWLYCEPYYPANGRYNLDRLKQMAERLPGRVGLSDHTDNLTLAQSALREFPDLAVIEKHFCYNEDLRGKTPDAGPWSLSQADFRKLAKVVHGS